MLGLLLATGVRRLLGRVEGGATSLNLARLMDRWRDRNRRDGEKIMKKERSGRRLFIKKYGHGPRMFLDSSASSG